MFFKLENGLVVNTRNIVAYGNKTIRFNCTISEIGKEHQYRTDWCEITEKDYERLNDLLLGNTDG
jgi:hypothetical protein